MEGDILSVSDVIKQAIAESEKQQKEVAAHMGWTPQNFSNRLKWNTVDADEWVEIAKFLGYDVKMVKDDGAELKEKRKGVGRRVVQMVGGVTYDTEKSDAICHTNEFVGSFFELYEDPEGRKFLVLYASWLEGSGIVMPVAEPDAQKFMADCMYKTGL